MDITEPNARIAARAALTAAIGAGGQAVEVKPLEWVDADEGMCTKWRAAALGGHYELVDFGKDDPGFAVNFHWGRPLSFWFIQGEPDERGPTGPKIFPTLKAAKSAAQADYERRILSALISPSPVGGQDLPVAGERRAWVVALPSGEAMHETPTFSSKSAAVEWGKGFWGEDEWNHGYQAIQVALSHPAPERAVEALREFAQFVADYSNDPHVVKEAHKHLAASTGEANHG